MYLRGQKYAACSHLGPSRIYWAWHGVGSDDGSTSLQRHPGQIQEQGVHPWETAVPLTVGLPIHLYKLNQCNSDYGQTVICF